MFSRAHPEICEGGGGGFFKLIPHSSCTHYTNHQSFLYKNGRVNDRLFRSLFQLADLWTRLQFIDKR